MPILSGGGGGFSGGTVPGATHFTAPVTVIPSSASGVVSLIAQAEARSPDGQDVFQVYNHAGVALASFDDSGYFELITARTENTGTFRLVGTNRDAFPNTFVFTVSAWDESLSATVDILSATAGGTVRVGSADSPASLVLLGGGIVTQAITSGALPTVAPVSATAFQCSATRDVSLLVPVTYNPGVATTATCKVDLSPDNVTFSTLITVTKPPGTVFDGSIEPVTLSVPAAWYVKLTVVNATLGIGTYY